MHAKFQIAGFQTKKEKRHRSLDFVWVFLLVHLLVQVTWWFLASDGSEIQANMEDADVSIRISHQNICYLLSHTN